jgi:peptidoglycan-associated lipoprotein
VKDEFKPMIEAHATYLKQNGKAKAFLQGNTDERGSREYNLALGQKRAESVKKMMSVLGVSESQMETVSFGEEKPKAEGHDESAWGQNRRTDIIYQGE